MQTATHDKNANSTTAYKVQQKGLAIFS